jgi:nitrous oxide reductase accessory protein NosL
VKTNLGKGAEPNPWQPGRRSFEKGDLFLNLFFLIAVSIAAGPTDPTPSPKDRCPVCGMYVAMFPDWNARVEFKDSTQTIFDRAKCRFKYSLNINKYNPPKNNKDVTAISVKDYYSKASIDVLRAFFVIWSDVYGPMGHEPIPFKKETDARKFLEEHKGKKILKFKDINSKVIRSLDNP